MAKNSKSSNGTVVRRVKAGGAGSDSSAARTDDKAIRKVSASVEPTKKAKDDKSAAKISRSKTNIRRKLGKRSFFLFRPFFAIGRYFRDSWYELRQVQWTNRRATWALTLAVILFSAFFALFILLFDNIFQWLVQEVIL